MSEDEFIIDTKELPEDAGTVIYIQCTTCGKEGKYLIEPIKDN